MWSQFSSPSQGFIFSCYTFFKPTFFFLNATYHKLIGLRPLTVSNKIRIKKKNFHKSFLKVGWV